MFYVKTITGWRANYRTIQSFKYGNGIRYSCIDETHGTGTEIIYNMYFSQYFLQYRFYAEQSIFAHIFKFGAV